MIESVLGVDVYGGGAATILLAAPAPLPAAPPAPYASEALREAYDEVRSRPEPLDEVDPARTGPTPAI